MNIIDQYLNKITMYRLMLWGLSLLAVIALIGSALKYIAFSFWGMVFSLITILLSTEITNIVLGRVFKTPINIESGWISGLILFFILSPVSQSGDIYILIAAGIIAMLSKYALAIHGRHIFNPAAISILILELFGSGLAIWWIANPFMSLPTLVLGLLVVRKIRRFPMFFIFSIVALVILSIANRVYASSIADLFYQILISWPLIFFGTIMLTEPLTTPPNKHLRLIYAALIAIFFSLQFHFGHLVSTPELALIIGNLFSYFVSSKHKFFLRFINRRELSPNVYAFSFAADYRPHFEAGQYLEWTLSGRGYDSRGNRRFFTIASSPVDTELELGSKIEMKDGSKFKERLMNLQPGDKITASNLSGDFTLPKDQSKKLLFIAGGIGITPFRSMIRWLKAKGEKRDIVLIYAANTLADFAYKDEMEEGKESIGLKTIYLNGFLSEELLNKEISDLKDRLVYLSGPNAMVTNYKKLVKKMGVPGRQIKVDYFPGF